MKVFFLMLTLVIQIITTPLLTQAKEPSLTLNDIRQSVKFKVFVPQELPDDWSMSLKTYPPKGIGTTHKITLTYADQNEETCLNLSERKTTLKELNPEYYFYAEKTEVNGHIGYFLSSPVKSGHLLVWIQDGTFLEMQAILTKEQMIDIAASMKELPAKG